MAARTCRMELRMTKDEYDVLKEKAGRAGLSLSAFVRKAVAGKEIAESPPADVPMLIRDCAGSASTSIRSCGQSTEKAFWMSRSSGGRWK